jgi:hypothetical protein
MQPTQEQQLNFINNKCNKCMNGYNIVFNQIKLVILWFTFNWRYINRLYFTCCK